MTNDGSVNSSPKPLRVASSRRCNTQHDCLKQKHEITVYFGEIEYCPTAIRKFIALLAAGPRNHIFRYISVETSAGALAAL